MTWLEIIGVISIAISMPLGMAVVFMYVLEAWANQKHIRKALLAFYLAKLQKENRKRRGP